MGAFEVRLDPAGYSRVSEPGFPAQWTGADLWRKAQVAEASTLVKLTGSDSIYNPPGSEWLTMLPQQLTAEYFDPAVVGHEQATYRKTEIAFGGGFTVNEFDAARKPGVSPGSNSDWWQTIQQTPATIISQDSCNYTAMETPTGVELPAGFGTVLFVGNTPARTGSPQPLNQADYTPCLRWHSSPWPDTTFAFGFASFAFVITNETIYVLSTANQKQAWQLLGKIAVGASGSPYGPQAAIRSGGGSMLMASPLHSQAHFLCVMPVGPDTIYVYTDTAEPTPFTVLNPTTSLHEERLFPGGTFWLGMAPKRKLTFQLQCVSYYSFGTSSVVYQSPQLSGQDALFDLGESYKPTAAPLLALQYRVQSYQGIGTVASGSGSGPHTITAAGGQGIVWELKDEAAATWASDGTHSAGWLSLKLTPGNAVTGQSETFLAPQIRGLQLNFPRVLTARINSEKTLTDQQVISWSAETSLTDPDGKSIEIVLQPEAGDLLLGGGNWDYRGGYPVHIVEGGIVRVRGWVDGPDLEELVIESTGGRATTLRAYKITAKALLSRADGGWVYLPELVNPLGDGYIEHSWVVEEVLKGCGFDTTDATIYLAATDPQAGTGIAQLPGTWGATMGTSGEKDEGAYNPDYAQTKLEYLKALTLEFRGWRLYETLAGLIRYHSDHSFWFGTGGRKYTVAATIYRSNAEADTASLPGQYMMKQPTRTMIAPVANHVRISGQGENAETFPNIYEMAPETVTDIADENFLGEYKAVAYPSKLAVEEVKIKALCHIALRLNKHRRRLWHVAVPLAPWQIGGSGVNLGDVLTLNGNTRSDCWIAHMAVFCQKRDKYVTRLTCERIPANNAVTAVGACTGGTPFPGACLVS